MAQDATSRCKKQLSESERIVPMLGYLVEELGKEPEVVDDGWSKWFDKSGVSRLSNRANSYEINKPSSGLEDMREVDMKLEISDMEK